MNDHLIDLKLKKLIELCLVSLNYKKIAVVIFTLMSNRLDEIGIRLGIKPRDKKSGEKIYDYMIIINKILQNNFALPLFEEAIIDNIRTIEILFLRKRGEISLNHIKKVIAYYYDLRFLDVPDVYQSYSNEQLYDHSPLKALSFLSGKKNGKHGSKFRPLLLQRIKEEERQMRLNLADKFDPEVFEKIIHLNIIQKSLERQHSGKIVVHGALKDNINYSTSKEKIVGYLILGWLILFVLFSVNLAYQSIIFPETSMGVSTYLLLSFGACGFLISLYRYYYKIGGGI